MLLLLTGLFLVLCCNSVGGQNGFYNHRAVAMSFDIPPPGMASLTFVFDRTGSMNDDLVQVRHGAKSIFETVMKQRKKLIYNYVLVLFHDPDVDPAFVTTDPDVFQQELASVTVQGGGDCPEMSLTGIKKALEVSLPGSYIYVFTDARAKDYHLEERILNLIQEKHSSVVFVLTGDCGNRTAPGYRTYEKIAAASFGQVFHLEKSHVNTVLEYVRHTIEQRKIHMLYEVREKGQVLISPVAVDGLMTELTISLSGARDDSEYLNITLIDPEGDTVDKARYENQAGTIDLKNVKLIRVKDPQPGVWKVRTTSKNKHTLRIFGHSTIDFKYGFTTRVVDTIELAHPRPIANQLTYLMINMTGLDPPGLLMQVSLLDYNGRILYKNESRIHKHNSNLYYVGPFMPPKGYFFVRVQGEDDAGYEFIRISSTAISTVDATGPRAYMADRTTATAFQSVNLTCSVESVSPYTIYWKHANDVIGGPLFYQQTDTSIWTIDSVTAQNRGYYSCVVVSSAGNHTALTYLDSREPPPHITAARNQSVILRETAYLHCRTQSNEEPRILWERHGVIVGNSAKVYQYPNGTLRILDATRRDSGFYLCRATTSGGTDEANVFLNVYEMPTITVSPSILYVAAGQGFKLECKVGGEPVPESSWVFKGMQVQLDRNHYFSHNDLIVNTVGDQDIGVYECRASNPAGIAVDYANVQYAIPPLIQLGKEKEMISRGDQVILDCRIIKGVPKPQIKWFKNDRELFQHAGLLIHDERLTIQNAQDMDAGTYHCKAENVAGSDSKTMTLEVGARPQIIHFPDRIQANIETTVKLQCRAHGAPNPTIGWTKDRKPIELLGDGRYSFALDGTLIIRDLRVEDQGYFTCEARNQFGVDIKNTLLTITGLVSPVLAPAPSEMDLIEGQNLILNCIVLMGMPKPITKWYKNGVEIIRPGIGEHTIVQDDGSLVLLDGLADQQGQYSCKAFSQAGNASLDINIRLIRKPTMTGRPMPEFFNARLGDSVDLNCPIESFDGSKAIWTMNGEVVATSAPAYTIMPDNTLRIHDTEQVHAGQYVCSVTNQAGEARITVNVQVQIPPSIAPAQSSYNTIQGDSIVLECTVEAEPKATIEWYLNDQLIKDPVFDPDTGGLVLDDIKESNRGLYKCVASNPIGTDERTIMLTVHTAPVIDSVGLAKIKHAKVNDTVILDCPARAFPEPERLWYFEGTQIYPRNADDMSVELPFNGSLILRNVQLIHSGNYECHVSNLAGEDQIVYSLQVQSPAKIKQPLPKQTDAISGVSVVLNCRADGTPEPIIMWEKDGVALNVTNTNFQIIQSGTLRIRQPSPADNGYYKCAAINIVGADTTQTYLNVKAPPFIKSTQKYKYQLVEGNPGTINCQFEGTPLPKVDWFFEDRNLSELPNEFNVFQNGTLQIFKVDATHAGLYTCSLNNDAGTSDATVSVDVLTKPKINEQAETQIVHAGSPLVLHCPVASNLPLQINWLWNGRDLNENALTGVKLSSDKRTLRLDQTRLVDAGNFICTVKNAAGEASKTFVVSVDVAPFIDNKMKRKFAVMEGEHVELVCPVRGTPSPNISWLATLGRNTESDAQNIKTGEVLTIESAQLHHSGAFVCVASNRAGTLDAEVELDVLALPKIVHSFVEPALTGKPVTLNCDVENNDGSTTTKWLFNTQEVLPDNVQVAKQGSRLIILSSTEENRGLYTCVVRNQIGESSQDFPLEIIVPPHLINSDPSAELTLIEGQQETLHCEAHGNPLPTIQWFRDGVALKDVQNKQTIVIKSADEGDSVTKNRYSCLVTNEAGTVSKDFFVESVFSPKLAHVPEEQQKIDVYEGNTATFECPVQNLRPDDFEITWLHRGRSINIDSKNYALSLDRTRLNILNINHVYEGDYQCVVRNQAGEVKSQFELKVLIPPIIVGEEETTLELIEDQELDLECIYNGQPTPTSDWTKDGLAIGSHIKLINNNQFLYTEKVKKSDEGTYNCRVRNSGGIATKKFHVKVIEKPSLMSSVPETSNVGVQLAHSITLECLVQVDKSTQTDYVWLKNGQNLNQLYPTNNESKFKLLDQGRKLQLMFANEHDTGLYSCLAKNRGGEVKKDYDLLVKVPPSINAGLQQAFKVVENSSLVIPCDADGTPKPDIIWSQGSYVFSSDQSQSVHVTGDGKHLKIGSVRVEHAGFYSCRATNELGSAEVSYQVEVIQKPAFISTIDENKEFISGDSAVLECPIKGPILDTQITWLYNSKPIDFNNPHYLTSFHDQKLFITNIGVEDRGTYSCHAKNAAGERRKNYSVDILVKPTISLLNRDKRVALIENTSLLLDCPASGNPEPQIQWSKDGKKLTVENIRSVIKGAELIGSTIHVVNIQQESGSGRYICEATNKAGLDEAEILVDVMTMPKIKRDDATTIIDGELGNRAEIECLVEGHPQPAITWLKNNSPLDLSDNSFQYYTTHNHQRLNFIDLKLHDAARYSCVAKNEAGEDRRDIDLRFIEMPRIDSSNVPSEQTFILGRPMTLSCPASGQPEPTIVWVRDGHVLGIQDSEGKDDDGRVVLVSGGRQLKIEKAETIDAGRYSCIATNAAGAADLDTTVRIIDKPKIYGSQREYVEILLSRPHTLDCIVDDAGEPLEIEWRKGGQIVGGTLSASDTSIQITDRNRKLHILSAHKTNATTWSCLVRNQAGETQKDFGVNILIKPTIDEVKSSPPIINALHGDELKLDCVVEANPKAEITWLKDGKQIDEQSQRYQVKFEKQTLVIPNSNPLNDDGRYTCEAENKAGIASRTFVIKLAGPPELGVGFVEVKVNHGENAMLDCTAISDNGPFITFWSFNGQDLESMETAHVVVDNARLLLNDVQLNMSGEYKCEVQNNAGSASKTFKFMVQKRPYFLDQSGASPTIIVDRSLILDCTVDGTPQPIVTWRKDGEILIATPEREFINNHQQVYIDLAKEADAGLYTCIAQNDQGTTSKNLYVSVLDPPSMTQKFTDVEVKENETLTLKCPVKNPQMADIKWLKDGHSINNSLHFHVTEQGLNLQLINIQKHHKGSYSCLAQNEAGTEESTFGLIVLMAPVIRQPLVGSRNVAVMLNQTVELKCQVDGVPIPEISWQFDGVTFATSHGDAVIALNNTQSEFVISEGTAKVKIINATNNAQGRYTCLALNKAGRSEADIFVQVMEPPRLTTPSEYVQVVQGKELSLHCQVLNGARQMSASWQKGNKTMPSSIEQSDGTATYYLHTSNVQSSDAGVYVCSVQNEAGISELTIKVEVLVPPSIGNGERLLKVIEDSQLLLDCNSQGQPTPKVNWYFGSTQIQSEGNNKYLLQNANASMSGKYSCEAVNSAGTATADFYVEVLVKPRIKPYEKLIRALEGNQTRLECKFDGNPEPTVKWLRNGRPINDSSKYILSPRGETLLIPKASREDAGDYSCIVQNNAGSMEAPFIVAVQTGPHIDEPIDQNPQIIEGGTVVLQCPVLGSPQPIVEWKKDGNDLNLDTNPKYLLDETSNLKIVNATDNDKGRYTCHAENEIGTLDTDYELGVMAPPKFGTNGTRNFQAIEGLSINIECPVEASPAPTIIWHRGETRLRSDANIQISPNAMKLKILKTSLSDGGKYTCRASNLAGTTDIDLNLKVVVPPKIDESNLITHPVAILGRSIYLECPVTAIPQPSIHWLKDSLPIQYESLVDQENSKFSLQQSNQTFGIRNVENVDKGIYTCVVENPGGKITQDFDVEVLVPPVMEKKETEQLTIREGQALGLTCPVKSSFDKNGSLDLAITWSHDGRPLDKTMKNVEITGDGKHLKILDAKVANAGQFKCVANNRAGQSHAKFDVDVLSVPIIEEEKLNVEPNVPVGHATTLWCPVSGHPPPTVKWFRGDGKEVQDIPGKIKLLERGQGLEISEAGMDDIGTWTCRAENLAGTTEKVIKLNVWVEPKVNVYAQDGMAVMPIGSTITLFCNASGNPKPALSWNFNGQLLIPSIESAQISAFGGRLDIVSLEEHSTGNYSCVAKNELGLAEASIPVDILVPPKIERQNVEFNRKLPSGRSTTLFCDAAGKPTPKIKWFFNQELITDKFPNIVMGTDNKYIQITNVTLKDKGIYRCSVENNAGGDEIDYIITVNLSPSIVSSGTTQVKEKDVALMACKADGEPKPKVTWQRNGIRVETGLRYIVNDDGSLKIIGTQSGDSGIYVCVATNEAGTDQQAFTLEVLVAPSVVKASDNETIVAVGSEFSLICEAAGYPHPTVQWAYNDEPIEEALAGTNYSISDEGTLTVRGFGERGDLPFSCKVENDAGSDSRSYVVKAISAPTRVGTNGTRQLNMTQGQPTIIICEIPIDSPESKVVWRRNGELLKNTDAKFTVENKKGQIRLMETNLQDEGTYECTVTNSIGNASEKTDLFIGVPPKISNQSKKVLVKKGERAKIWCETVGIPPPKLEWHKNNVSIPKEHIFFDESEDRRLAAIFDNVQVEHEGVYTCVASNWAGKDESDIDLVVLVAPVVVPQQLEVNASLGDIIILPCNATGNPEPVVTWVKVPNLDLVGREEKYQLLGTSLAIKNVTMDDDDFYHCVAKSDSGQTIGIRRITINNVQLDGPSRVWVECDADGRPAQNSYIPPRGDSPDPVNPMDIEYLPWEDRNIHIDRRGPNVVYYKCVPTSRDQRSSGSTNPTDTPPQLIEQPPRLLKIKQEDGLKLKCSATGSPQPIIVWRHEDGILRESFDGNLQLFANDSRLHEGNYTCVAQNPVGEQRVTVNVEFHAAEKSTPTPPTLTPITILNCPNSLPPNAEVYWEVDGQRIEPNVVNDRMHVLANSSLVLSYFAEDDELRQFQCVYVNASNKEGTKFDGKAEVYMQLDEEAPQVDIPQPARLHGQTRESIMIDCKLIKGTPLTTRIRWTKDNVNLDVDRDHYFVLPNNSLIINNLTEFDRGSYKCRAWNKKGKSFDETGLITGDVPAFIEAYIHGNINGRIIEPKTIQFAQMDANINSNDLLAKLLNLPSPLGANASKIENKLVALMATPTLQAGFDPDRQIDEPDPKTVAFERTTNYQFASGEKMKVKQKSNGLNKDDKKLVIDVEFGGDLPKVEDDFVKISPVNSELVAKNASQLVGNGKSSVKFGDRGLIPFQFDDKIDYPNSNPNNSLIRPGTTLKLHSDVSIPANATDEMRLKLKNNRQINCPKGHEKKQQGCVDIDECSKRSNPCGDNANCTNTEGSYKCERQCDKGFMVNESGECVDIDECTLGKSQCANDTDCLNTEGGYSCAIACPFGYFMDETGACLDVNECARDDACPDSMKCVNLAGGHQCVCPFGSTSNDDDGAKCQGTKEAEIKPLQNLVYSTEPDDVDCPSGLQWTDTTCMDIDECAFDAPCQYKCLNKVGGYECICPENYALDEFGQCIDIDECQMKDACNKDDLCFNQLGDYECISDPCPKNYKLRLEDPDSAHCIPTCQNCSKNIIHIYLIPMPAGLPQGTPLARLAAHDTQSRVLKNTTFHEEDSHDEIQTNADHALDVQTDSGRAIVRLNNKLAPGTRHDLKLRSSSVSSDGNHKYASNFHIYTAVSKYPF